jgi:hypothetical protein
MSADEMTELPKFHDGYLDGMRIRENHVVELYLRNVGGETFTLELRGVERLCFHEVREGNIIFDLILRDVRNADKNDIQTLGLAGPGGTDAAYLARLRSSERMILEINPSYGAGGLVVFETFALNQVRER